MTIALRTPTPADADALADLLTRNRVYFQTGEPLRPDEFYTPDHQAQVIRDAENARQAGASVLYLIEDDGAVVGRANLNSIIRGAFQSASVGYAVDQAHTGRASLRPHSVSSSASPSPSWACTASKAKPWSTTPPHSASSPTAASSTTAPPPTTSAFTGSRRPTTSFSSSTPTGAINQGAGWTVAPRVSLVGQAGAGLRADGTVRVTSGLHGRTLCVCICHSTTAERDTTLVSSRHGDDVATDRG